MSETANIAAIAEMISENLFGAFGWLTVGPKNFNFQENESEETKRRSKWPCDVIFEYADPFHATNPIYLLTDLKSYARETVEDKKKIKNAITNLGKSLRVAVNSDDFQKHLHEEGSRISALLFVYNHDECYEKDFDAVITANMPSPLDLPPNSSLYIIGPTCIRFLLDIYNDLQKIFGENEVNSGKFLFHYPNLVSKVPTRNNWTTAIPEMLLGPYIPVIYDKEIIENDGGLTVKSSKRNIQFYYRGSGASYEEFCFILDYLFKYNIVDDCSKVSIRIPGPDGSYLSQFEKAKEEFSKAFYSQDKAFEKLKAIECKSISTQSQRFSDIELGMEKRKEFSNASA